MYRRSNSRVARIFFALAFFSASLCVYKSIQASSYLLFCPAIEVQGGGVTNYECLTPGWYCTMNALAESNRNMSAIDRFESPGTTHHLHL